MAGPGKPGSPGEPESDVPESDVPEPDAPERDVHESDVPDLSVSEPSVSEPSAPQPSEPETAESIRPWWAATAANPLPPAAQSAPAVPAHPSAPQADAAADASGRAGTSPASVSGATAAGVSGRPAKVHRDSVMDEPDRDRTPLRLVWGAGILLALVILFSLFFLGQRIGSSPTVLPTPTPTPTPAPTAAQPPGAHVWNTLFGGECLQPYTSPWDHEFTVVDCATPHAAQLAYRGTFDPKSAFPGEGVLTDRINKLCTAPGIIDLAAARDYPHLVMQGSYPITAEQWKDNPYYYCFVSSESGQPITADIAGPGPSTAPAAQPGTSAAPTPAA